MTADESINVIRYQEFSLRLLRLLNLYSGKGTKSEMPALMQAVALLAVYFPAAGGLKGHFGCLAAIRAGRFVHLAGSRFTCGLFCFFSGASGFILRFH